MKCTPNVRQKLSNIWRCTLLCQNINMKKNLKLYLELLKMECQHKQVQKLLEQH